MVCKFFLGSLCADPIVLRRTNDKKSWPQVGNYFEKLAPPFDWKDKLQELHAHVLSHLLLHRSTLFNQEGGLQKSRLNDMFLNSFVGSSLERDAENRQQKSWQALLGRVWQQEEVQPSTGWKRCCLDEQSVSEV